LQVDNRGGDSGDATAERSCAAGALTVQMERVRLGLYAVIGIFSLIAGSAALIRPSLAVDRAASDGLVDHLVREQGAGFVFIGLMALWGLLRPDLRRGVHLALIVFAALFAVIHWYAFGLDQRNLVSPLVTSVPVTMLLATMPRRQGTA
jgi:hypothetical protein